MTNTLVGDVYAKIIEEVVNASTTDFEEYAVQSSTLQEMQQEWQAKLSQRSVAQMPWDPKPAPPPPAIAAPPPTIANASNGVTPSAYTSYDSSQTSTANGTPQIKVEPKAEPQYASAGTYQSNPPPVTTQGGAARAQQLMQQQYGQAANASINAMQQRGGLALPGQNTKPSVAAPGGLQPNAQQQFLAQQQAAMQRQQQQYQGQGQPRIKVENESHNMAQPAYTMPSTTTSNYGQTDGAGDSDADLDQWRLMLAARRAMAAEQIQQNDRLMHNQITNAAHNLQSGLLLPLNERPRTQNPTHAFRSISHSTSAPTVPQLDGDVDDEDEPRPAPYRAVDEDEDENAINSDLDDPDEDGQGAIGGDDDEDGDTILCTYDKVQRVKNKWKCVLKDGVMTVDGKEWVFHKGTGEFEW